MRYFSLSHREREWMAGPALSMGTYGRSRNQDGSENSQHDPSWWGEDFPFCFQLSYLQGLSHNSQRQPLCAQHNRTDASESERRSQLAFSSLCFVVVCIFFPFKINICDLCTREAMSGVPHDD